MSKRIAVFHDDFSTWGGAERFVILLADHLGADIVTFSLPDQIASLVKQYAKSELKILTLVPGKVKDPFHTIKRYFFSLADFSKDYDIFIFSGNYSLAAAPKHKPNVLYMHHSPIELFGFGDPAKSSQDISFFTKRFLAIKEWVKSVMPEWAISLTDRLLFLIVASFDFSQLRYYPFRLTAESHLADMAGVDIILSNSKFTQDRVKMSCGRDSKVVYPIVETGKFYWSGTGDYWLSINRIIQHKRIDLQLEAFSLLPEEKLLIIGNIDSNQYYQVLLRNKPKNVEFMGLVDEQRMLSLLANCKGFIFTGQDEDFGVTPVEAMAAGKVVIAPNEGGLRETILPGETGVLIENITAEKISSAVREINKLLTVDPLKYREVGKNHSKNFDTEVFLNQLRSLL